MFVLQKLKYFVKDYIWKGIFSNITINNFKDYGINSYKFSGDSHNIFCGGAYFSLDKYFNDVSGARDFINCFKKQFETSDKSQLYIGYRYKDIKDLKKSVKLFLVEDYLIEKHKMQDPSSITRIVNDVMLKIAFKTINIDDIKYKNGKIIDINVYRNE
jgi:hypothetical protein